MASKELIDYVNSMTDCEETKATYHQVCGLLLAQGLSVAKIKSVLQ